MNDSDGQELKPGDRVLWCKHGRYGGMRIRYVRGFTPKMVRVSREPDSDRTTNVTAGRLIKTLRQE